LSAKRWSLIVISFIFTICIFISFFLYNLDTYNIRHPEAKKYYSIPNQRVLIIDYLLDKNHYKNYNSYIFGSSRVGYLNPFHIKKFKTYNMTYAEGLPHEHLLILKFFLKHHFPIKHLLIGLDEFSYQVPFSRHDNQYASKSHYLVTNTSLYDFYKFYFFRQITKYDRKHFINKFIKNKPIKYTNKIYNRIYNQKDTYLNIKQPNNHNQQYENDPKFLNPTPYVGLELKNTLKDIKEIVKLAKQHNIELHIYINPIHHTTYDFTNKTLLKIFREKLSHITSYYDFSYPSYISKDNGYWNDTSHYNYNVGNMILDKIYNKNSTIKDFGIFVKKVD
jgi:hypothetical protein